MIKTLHQNKPIFFKEATTKENKTIAQKLVEKANTIGVKNLESELYKMNFTLLPQ